MIGGEPRVVKHLDPIFATLAPGAGNIPRTPGREAIGGTAAWTAVEMPALGAQAEKPAGEANST